MFFFLGWFCVRGVGKEGEVVIFLRGSGEVMMSANGLA